MEVKVGAKVRAKVQWLMQTSHKGLEKLQTAVHYAGHLLTSRLRWFRHKKILDRPE